jgi:oxygen-independent coproporphyrinogen-3 oxidase
MIGVGVSSIGDVRGAFAQNEKKLPRYYEALDAGRFPIERGYALDPDDLVRRHVITELMCNFHLSRPDVERRFGLDFDAYFAPEIAELSATDGPVADGFLTIGPEALDVTPRGRLFVRNICMAFDRYLPAHQRGRPVFSRTI